MLLHDIHEVKWRHWTEQKPTPPYWRHSQTELKCWSRNSLVSRLFANRVFRLIIWYHTHQFETTENAVVENAARSRKLGWKMQYSAYSTPPAFSASKQFVCILKSIRRNPAAKWRCLLLWTEWRQVRPIVGLRISVRKWLSPSPAQAVVKIVTRKREARLRRWLTMAHDWQRGGDTLDLVSAPSSFAAYLLIEIRRSQFYCQWITYHFPHISRFAVHPIAT